MTEMLIVNYILKQLQDVGMLTENECCMARIYYEEEKSSAAAVA